MTTDTTRSDALRDRAMAGYPDSWIPEKKGESLTGIFVGLSRASTGYGPASIVILDVEGVRRSVWLMHQALRSQFVQARPELGELVCVYYNGKVKAKNPAPGRSDSYHSYRVVVDRPVDAGSTWDALDAETNPGADAVAGSESDIPY